MSPVSRRRKKPPSKRQGGKTAHAGGPTLTPDYSKAQRTVFGPESPAEVKLLTGLCDVWQQLAQGVPANHCIHAVCAIRSALAEWDVESEPLTVTALVTWPPDLAIELGEPRPTWRSKTHWSGHLGLWVPGLGRFVDPTLYQANRPQAPTDITRGVVLPLAPQQLGMYAFPKDGATVQYGVVDDPGPSWRTGMSVSGKAEVEGNSATFRAAFARALETPEVKAIRSALTYEPLAAALRPAR